MTTLCSLSDDAMLDRLQRAAFGYFTETMNPRNGLIPDTSRPHSPVSIAVVGFALSCYPAAVARGWIERAEAVRRSLLALRFFHDSDQSGSPTATGYKGFYYHFLDIDSGARVWQSELSMIDSALLIAGMLTVATAFDGPGAEETELRELADALYRRVDWRWSQDDARTIYQGWKPESGYLHYGWEGYSEATILYVLGIASPTHPLPAKSFKAWTATYQWESIYDVECLYAGPFFIHHFSQAWIDFAGIQDEFMREKNCDYFENTRRATLIQREYARRYLPAEIVERRKRGLSVPLGQWLRGPLRDWATERLSGEDLRNVGIRTDAALALMEEHMQRRGDHARGLWNLIVLSEWLEWAKEARNNASSMHELPVQAALLRASSF